MTTLKRGIFELYDEVGIKTSNSYVFDVFTMIFQITNQQQLSHIRSKLESSHPSHQVL